MLCNFFTAISSDIHPTQTGRDSIRIHFTTDFPNCCIILDARRQLILSRPARAKSPGFVTSEIRGGRLGRRGKRGSEETRYSGARVTIALAIPGARTTGSEQSGVGMQKRGGGGGKKGALETGRAAEAENRGPTSA